MHIQQCILSCVKQLLLLNDNQLLILSQLKLLIDCEVVYKSGADPDFPVGGGANLLGGGANLRFCQKFPKYRMKLRKFWAVAGHKPLQIMCYVEIVLDA